MNIIFNLLHELLDKLYFVIGDWGITIIAITFVVRLLLLPLSLRQRKGMEKQKELATKIEKIKDTYKNDQSKIDAEMKGLSAESAKNALGCLVTFAQLPIMYCLYRVFSSMPTSVESRIVPWVPNLNMPDVWFIIPVIAALIQLAPNILSWFGVFKDSGLTKMNISQIIILCVINMVFLVNAPASIGIYWISSSVFSTLEQIIYGIYRGRRLGKSGPGGALA